jgi:D-3-phosphoglycerate dehydrogenase
MITGASVHERIVSTAAIDRTAIEILEGIAPVQIADSPEEQTMMGLLEGTIGLVCRGEGKITGRLIETCRTLRVVGRPGAGYDTVDIAAATARKIPVVYAPLSAFAVAEGALALLMTLVKRLPLCDQIVKTGQWQRRYELKTGDMAGHTIGIVGLGKIGAYLAKLVGPFEMTVLGYDPFVSRQRGHELGVEVVELHDLLQRSDYVSLHVPLTEQTRGLINRDRLAAMKKGAILINTSRGGIVESLDVLADALQSGQLGAVGLDVFPAEPPDASHQIFQDPRCVCAPHVVGVTAVSMDRIYRSMANDMVAVLSGQRPTYCVNPEVFD